MDQYSEGSVKPRVSSIRPFIEPGTSTVIPRGLILVRCSRLSAALNLPLSDRGSFTEPTTEDPTEEATEWGGLDSYSLVGPFFHTCTSGKSIFIEYELTMLDLR